MSTSSLTKKIGTLLMGLVLLGGATLGVPQTAYALGEPVIDATNLVQNTFSAIRAAAAETKEYVLDTLVWEVGNIAIQSMTRSIVNWINSGFQGSPAFVTDLQTNLRGVSDAVAARFFEELAMQDITTTPFQDRVLDAVRLGYYLRTSPESFYTRYPYTLGQVSPDPDSFLAGDFSQGGFNAWFSAILNPQNNPYGAQELANRALEGAINEAAGTRLEELSWNRGFLSWRGECQEYTAEDDIAALSGSDPCLTYEIRTPGSVIMEQLNSTFEGAGIDRLVSADEFNEIIGALLNQLVLQVLGGNDGGGLLGSTQPSSGGGSSFIDRATRPSGSNIGNTFSATITRQLNNLREFQTDWERIRTAAQGALSRCGAGGEPDPQETIEEAGRMLVKAADAIAVLEEIQREIEAALAEGGNQSEGLLIVSQRYNDLINSNTLPSPEEYAYAKTEGLDTGDAEPGSLYSQFTRMAAGSCNANNGS